MESSEETGEVEKVKYQEAEEPTEEEQSGDNFLVYGVHSNDIRRDIKKILDILEEEKDVRSERVGYVDAYSSFWVDFVLFVFTVGIMAIGAFLASARLEFFWPIMLIAITLIILYPILWYVVTFVLSIFTFGTFFKHRYLAITSTTKSDETFLSKLIVTVALRGGIFDHQTGDPEFDEWSSQALRLYRRVTYTRILAVLFGLIWGVMEIYQRVNLIPILYQIDLWPLRILMILIYIPLFIYCLHALMRIRRHYAAGDQMIYRLKYSSSRFDPEIPLSKSYDSEF